MMVYSSRHRRGGQLRTGAHGVEDVDEVGLAVAVGDVSDHDTCSLLFSGL